MSKENFRKDKTCLNCYHVVEKRFCGNCGQENTESRKTFHHLFTHFVEDLVHYDGGFWKTIHMLLKRPGFLTREYLSGRRKSYVPPVKLYIFINFLTFFLMSLLLSPAEAFKEGENNPNGVNINMPEEEAPLFFDYKNIKELDSAQAVRPADKKYNKMEYWFMRKFVTLNQKYTHKEFFEKFSESFIGNIPKVLFLYMPFFAFVLWIFHGKKRWYYFDHGIFTLHYFSFLLITLSFYFVIDYLLDFLPMLRGISAFVLFVLELWWIFYFFRSHRRFYGESKLVSRSKGFALFIINMIFILFFLVMATIYTAMVMH